MSSNCDPFYSEVASVLIKHPEAKSTAAPNYINNVCASSLFWSESNSQNIWSLTAADTESPAAGNELEKYNNNSLLKAYLDGRINIDPTRSDYSVDRKYIWSIYLYIYMIWHWYEQCVLGKTFILKD